MKYNKGQIVIEKSTKKAHLIEDYEKICGVEIYYMEDKTSFSSDQIELINLTDEQKILITILINQEKIKKFIDSKKISENFCKNYAKMFNKSQQLIGRSSS